MNKKRATKFALVFSVILMIAWSMLGTGATIAWFTDTTPVVQNSFVIGQLEMEVSYKRDIRDEYALMDGSTKLFDENALYEPNYTQVVYLQIHNKGNVPFRYKVSVDKRDWKDSINVYGGDLHLPEFLRYGIIFGADEADLTRELAHSYADRDMLELMQLNQYSEPDEVVVEPGDYRYVALIVYMPWQTGNQANHMPGAPVPYVDLGITLYAQQSDAPWPTTNP